MRLASIALTLFVLTSCVRFDKVEKRIVLVAIDGVATGEGGAGEATENTVVIRWRPSLEDASAVVLTWTVPAGVTELDISTAQGTQRIAVSTGELVLSGLGVGVATAVTVSVVNASPAASLDLSVVPGELWVSPLGDDTAGVGSAARPFARITHALLASANAVGWMNIRLAAGEYSAASGEVFPLSIPLQRRLLGTLEGDARLSIIRGLGAFVHPRTALPAIEACTTLVLTPAAARSSAGSAPESELQDVQVINGPSERAACGAFPVMAVVTKHSASLVQGVRVAWEAPPSDGATVVAHSGLITLGKEYVSAPMLRENHVTGFSYGIAAVEHAIALVERNQVRRRGSDMTQSCFTYETSAAASFSPLANVVRHLGNSGSGCHVGVSADGLARVFMGAVSGVRNDLTIVHDGVSEDRVAGISIQREASVIVCSTDISLSGSLRSANDTMAGISSAVGTGPLAIGTTGLGGLVNFAINCSLTSTGAPSLAPVTIYVSGNAHGIHHASEAKLNIVGSTIERAGGGRTLGVTTAVTPDSGVHVAGAGAEPIAIEKSLVRGFFVNVFGAAGSHAISMVSTQVEGCTTGACAAAQQTDQSAFLLTSPIDSSLTPQSPSTYFLNVKLMGANTVTVSTSTQL